MSRIDVEKVRAILAEVDGCLDDLDGTELDESDALEKDRSPGRRQRAFKSQQLQFVANRLELAASLVRVEYWHARGEQDPINPDRED